MRLFLLFVAFAVALAAQTTVPRKVILTWQDTQTDVSYAVYRAPGNCSGTPVFAKISSATVAEKRYEDVGPAAGSYCYVVRAVREGVESANSNTATATVGAPIIVPQPPTGLQSMVSVVVQALVNILKGLPARTDGVALHASTAPAQ